MDTEAAFVHVCKAWKEHMERIEEAQLLLGQSLKDKVIGQGYLTEGLVTTALKVTGG